MTRERVKEYNRHMETLTEALKASIEAHAALVALKGTGASPHQEYVAREKSAKAYREYLRLVLLENNPK